MSEHPGKTLLSQWIKPPTQPEQPPETQEPGQSFSSETKSVDRKLASELWGNIFRKPAPSIDPQPVPSVQLPTDETSQDVQMTDDEVNTQPTSPSSSFMVTLRVPSSLASQEPIPSSQTTIRSPSKEPSIPSKFVKPSLVHTFKVSSEKLRSIKPKLHPFFAKRTASTARDTTPSTKLGTPTHVLASSLSPSTSTFSLTRQYKVSTPRPPWKTEHIRPPRSWEIRSKLPRRSKTQLGQMNEEEPVLPTIYVPPPAKAPKRLLASTAQVEAMARHSQSPAFAASTNSLIQNSVGQLKPYDLGEFETKMWCEKYSPHTWQDHVSPASAQIVLQWLAKQFESRARMQTERSAYKAKRRRAPGYSMSDGFVVDDEPENDNLPSNDVLLVCGPTGSGKTSAVHAAASSLNAFVYEVSTAVRRTGKEVSSMLEGISQNHAVHKAKDVVILVDDGDIVFENETGGFWSVISRFAATSRRPVVITCTNERLVALGGVASETVYLPRPDLVRVTDLVWLIALSEGHVVDRLRLARLVVAWQGDIRRALTQLQLWCQFGIGGSPSSDEWVPKDYEMQENNAQRIICEGSWFPDVEVDPANESNEGSQLCPYKYENLCDVDSKSTNDMMRAELASLADIWPSVLTEVRRVGPEETLCGNGALAMSQWIDPVELPYRGNESVLHNVFALESSYGTSSRALATDVSPMMRFMVASDYQRFMIMQQALSQQTEREARMTRRMWQNSGIDCRQYLELSQDSMGVVLKTGYAPHLLN